MKPRVRVVSRLLLVLLLVGGAALSPPLACAQDYPSRAIKIIVPNPPGGAGDISARLIGTKLSDGYHQPVVIENQSGASGAIGMTMLRRSAPDGYTIGVVISLAQTIDLIQNKKPSFDIANDFTPITAVALNPAGFLVNSQVPTNSMADFIELARARPGEFSFGSAGIGTAPHLYGEVLNKVAGLKMVNVPYKGVAPALNDLLGGHIPAAIVSLATALPHLQGGRVRLLAVFDRKRSAKAPDVPAITEVLPSYQPARAWIGFLAPPDLPATLAMRLHKEIVGILHMPDVITVLGESGLEIIGNTPAEFAVMIREDAKIWDEAAAIAGLVSR